MNLEEKLYEALSDALSKKEFVISEFSFNTGDDDDTYFECGFYCYGIYLNRSEEAFKIVDSVFQQVLPKTKSYIAVISRPYSDYALFQCSSHKSVVEDVALSAKITNF